LPALIEQGKRVFDEGHVQIGALLEGREAGLVGIAQPIWDGVPPNIGRIAYDMREACPWTGFKEILVANPIARHATRRRLVNPKSLECRLGLQTKRRRDMRIDLIGADQRPESIKANPLPSTGAHKTPKQGQEKRALTRCRFQQPHGKEIFG